jgi:hypothetical protein
MSSFMTTKKPYRSRLENVEDDLQPLKTVAAMLQRLEMVTSRIRGWHAVFYVELGENRESDTPTAVT